MLVNTFRTCFKLYLISFLIWWFSFLENLSCMPFPGSHIRDKDQASCSTDMSNTSSHFLLCNTFGAILHKNCWFCGHFSLWCLLTFSKFTHIFIWLSFNKLLMSTLIITTHRNCCLFWLNPTYTILLFQILLEHQMWINPHRKIVQFLPVFKDLPQQIGKRNGFYCDISWYIIISSYYY